MSKRDVLQRKKELEREQARTRQEAANRAALAKMQAAAKAAPFMRILADGVYANGAWIAAKLGPLPSGWVKGIGAVEVEVPGPPGGTIPCCRVEDLEALFDSGSLGVGVMGRLEVFTITNFGDLGQWDRQMLGTEHTRRVSDPARQGLMDRFKLASTQVRGYGSYSQPHWPEGEPPQWGRGFLWAAVDGNPNKSPHETLEGCLPLEIGYSHSATVLLWVRSLSHVSACVQRTELGRARNRLARARQTVSDSPKGRAYLRELEGEAAALERELAGEATETKTATE